MNVSGACWRAGVAGSRRLFWGQGVRGAGTSGARVRAGGEVSGRYRETYAERMDETDPESGVLRRA